MWFKPVTLQRKSKGYTLTEMMITVAVMAIALGLAAPSLSTFIENNRMTNVSNKLISAIILARNEAVSRRRTVTINGDDSGWEVNVIPLTTTTGVQIANYTLDQGMVLTISDNSISGLTFTPNGFRDMSGSTASFYFTVCSPDTTNARRVNVSAAGTTSVTRNTDGCPE